MSKYNALWDYVQKNGKVSFHQQDIHERANGIFSSH